MKIPHILVNSANVLHILPILVNYAMLVNSANINMWYYEYFAYIIWYVTGVQGPIIQSWVRLKIKVLFLAMVGHSQANRYLANGI